MMKMKTRTVAGGVLLSLCSLAWCAPAGSNGTDKARQATLREAIEKSGSYLTKSVKPDGRFVYLLNMNPDVTVEDLYNWVRHSGAIYALCQYHELHPQKEVLQAALRAAGTLRSEMMGPVPGKEDMLAVWSQLESPQGQAWLQAKLGSSGLALAALVKVERVKPGFTPVEELQALARFIVYMQKDDGSFHSRYFLTEDEGPDDSWTSLYYPGEAALGLLMLYEIDGDRQWVEAATRALVYLANSRAGRPDVVFDHWALIATEKLFALTAGSDLSVPRELLVDHGLQICGVILQDHIIDPTRPDQDGGFTSSGRTTPSATRLEGLLAALSYLPAEDPARQMVELAVRRGIDFLLRAQVAEGEYAGAFPRAVAPWPYDERYPEEFDERATEVRVDYVQHALSAMIHQFLRLAESEPRSGSQSP